MRFALAFLFILLTACSHRTTQKSDESEISDVAKNKLTETRELIKADQLKMALAKLSELNDNTISALEKALKFLIGTLVVCCECNNYVYCFFKKK